LNLHALIERGIVDQIAYITIPVIHTVLPAKNRNPQSVKNTIISINPALTGRTATTIGWTDPRLIPALAEQITIAKAV
jgi:hypothetical protein